MDGHCTPECSLNGRIFGCTWINKQYLCHSTSFTYIPFHCSAWHFLLELPPKFVHSIWLSLLPSNCVFLLILVVVNLDNAWKLEVGNPLTPFFNECVASGDKVWLPLLNKRHHQGGWKFLTQNSHVSCIIWMVDDDSSTVNQALNADLLLLA
jgi:hypothetical protein